MVIDKVLTIRIICVRASQKSWFVIGYQYFDFGKSQTLFEFW